MLAQRESSAEMRLVAIGKESSTARKAHHRFGQFAEALDQVRARIEAAPLERTDLQRLCTALGIPGDFDVAPWRRLGSAMPLTFSQGLPA